MDINIFTDSSPEDLMFISLKWKLDMLHLQLSAVVETVPTEAVSIHNIKDWC